MRETLFNWLQWEISGSRCLDLFAGSGVLGLEALSRGAAHAHAIDADRDLCERLRHWGRELNAAEYRVTCADVFGYLGSATGEHYDLIFADPPFGQDLIPRLCDALIGSSLIGPNTRVYLEAEQSIATLVANRPLILKKSGRAGTVHHGLVVAAPPTESTLTLPFRRTARVAKNTG